MSTTQPRSPDQKNTQPVMDRIASVGSGNVFQASVSIEGDYPGERFVLFSGDREIADRIASCWNAQLGVPSHLIESAP